MSFYSFMINRAFSASDNRRDRSLTTPDDILRFDNISYGPELLDVYRPKTGDRFPVIVSVHGGGWVYGDKDRYQYYCMDLARRGFSVVNFTYRLAPKHKFPAALEDTCSAFSWVLTHADEYGFDLDNVFAVGDSAGAHLLSLFCCVCQDPSFAKELSVVPPEGFLPKAVALNCGVYQVERSKKKDLTTHLMEDLLPEKGTDRELKAISPVFHLLPGFPPAFIMTAEGDFLIPHAAMLADKLKSLGTPVEYRYYGDPEHVLGHVFHLKIRLDEAKHCNDEECAFFRQYMACSKSEL